MKSLDHNNKKFQIMKYINSMQALSVFLVMFIGMSILLPNFFTVLNLTNIMKQYSVSMILAVGTTFVIISGEIDISVGSLIALSGISAGIVIEDYGVFAGILAALAIGLAFGAFNGLIITKGRIPSFIATLGTMQMARSLSFVFSQGQVITSFPDSFRFIGQESIYGFPIIFMLVIIVYAISFIIFKKTKFGQHVYAVGGNRIAAILSGINADKIKMQVMMISGTIAGFCGLLLTSRAMAVQADTGRGMEFEVIAGAIIGGASLNGGVGNILQTIVGVAIIGLIRNGLNMSRIDIFWNDFVTGAVIIGAVLMDSMRKRMQNKSSINV
jgi:ribose/xylose/arabinose/galactoside ABC-type transport system permease subunit